MQSMFFLVVFFFKEIFTINIYFNLSICYLKRKENLQNIAMLAGLSVIVGFFLHLINKL